MSKVQKSTILNWITEENLFLKTLKTDKDKFRYLIKYANINLEVFNPLNTDKLLIVSPIQIHPSHLQQLEQLSLDERFKFLTELRIYFFQQELDFKMIPRDQKNLGEHMLVSLIISDFLVDDDNLTKANFLYRNRKVAFGAHGFIQRMYLKFGMAGESTSILHKNIYT